MAFQVVVLALIAAIYFLNQYLNRTNTPKIEGIPEVAGYPLFGSLIELGTNHAKVAQRWAEKYGPVFQVRMGNKRIVFANSFDSVRALWINNQSALISRPTLHTFHTVVSSSAGFTIGTSPWDESCKQRRKAAATALNKPAVQSYMPIIDLEATTSIRELLHDSQFGKKDVDPVGYFQRYALNTSLTLNYGFRITGNVEDKMLKEITAVERLVSNFRSTSNNWQDYIPMLRIWSWLKQDTGPQDARRRRDVYMHKLLSMLKEKIANGTDKPCITGNILKDPDTKLNDGEIDSIGLTMVSAGLDTVPGNLVMGLASLSTPEGQRIQQKAYAAIQSAYPSGDAWHRCLDEERIPYLTAFVKEVLRFWTVIPICLPRVSVKDIEWQGAVIPKGTTFYMNAYAADYDRSYFGDDVYTFRPERYLKVEDGGDGAFKEEAGTPHYGYGAGSRMCAGSHLANRELFVAFVRLIVAFEMVGPEDEKDKPTMDCLDANAIPTSLTMEPKSFKMGFRVRDRENLEKWIAESEENTKHL